MFLGENIWGTCQLRIPFLCTALNKHTCTSDIMFAEKKIPQPNENNQIMFNCICVCAIQIHSHINVDVFHLYTDTL